MAFGEVYTWVGVGLLEKCLGNQTISKSLIFAMLSASSVGNQHDGLMTWGVFSGKKYVLTLKFWLTSPSIIAVSSSVICAADADSNTTKNILD